MEHEPSHVSNKNANPATVHDLICVGFGPASLSIAVALHDSGIKARVLFLERQRQFAWHSGMLIPSSRMQISFLKDLATFRDPQSHFTFLNYLKCKGRLEAFTNLGTFYPRREEFHDYLTWAASHFTDCVQYGAEVQSVIPESGDEGSVIRWSVVSKDIRSEAVSHHLARNVVVAVGGVPMLPQSLQDLGSHVIHSSQYLKVVPELLSHHRGEPRVAIVGAGQSAAEIFDDLTTHYPIAYATLFTSDSALKPSDDSPFVNEIFDSARVDEFYALGPTERQKSVAGNRATNYSVVRPELIDRLYDKLYHQRLRGSDESAFKHRITGYRRLVDATHEENGKVKLRFADTRSLDHFLEEDGFDLVISSTGYLRTAHERILDPVRGLLKGSFNSVSRDYRLQMKENALANSCGIWLQGCCENSHGLGDTLLSLLAIRGGEIIESVFGSDWPRMNSKEYTQARCKE